MVVTYKRTLNYLPLCVLTARMSFQFQCEYVCPHAERTRRPFRTVKVGDILAPRRMLYFLSAIYLP